MLTSGIDEIDCGAFSMNKTMRGIYFHKYKDFSVIQRLKMHQHFQLRMNEKNKFILNVCANNSAAQG